MPGRSHGHPGSARAEITAAQYRALADFRFYIRRFVKIREDAAREAGIESQQYQLLLEVRALEGRGAATIGALATRLHVRHHSAVGLVDRLAARGFVARRRASGDRRRVMVDLLPDGRAILTRLARSSVKELRTEAPALVDALARLVHVRAPRSSRTTPSTRKGERR